MTATDKFFKLYKTSREFRMSCQTKYIAGSGRKVLYQVTTPSGEVYKVRHNRSRDERYDESYTLM